MNARTETVEREVTPRVTVIHLIHTMAYGGVETALINWLRRIDRSRFHVHLVCFANPGGTEAPFVEAAQRAGLEVDKIKWSRRKPVLRAARELARIARRHRADVIHSHNWYADFVCAAAAWMVDVKTITTLYVWFDYDWKRNILQWLDQHVVRNFDRITAHCEATREATLARGIAPERVQTLICGFETHPVALERAVRQQRREDLGAAQDEVVLLNVARFYPEKAHGFLLRCFARIRASAPRTKLWIAGIGPLEQEIRAQASALGLDDCVRFLGFVTELPELLALADIQVHPAEIEGVPLAVCEGMAAGLPIVASEVGGLPEVIQNGQRGLLVPRGDQEAFVRAVLGLIADVPLQRRLGSNAQRFITEDYSLQAAVRRVEDTYLDMMRCVSVSS
jgi:L-malate glycosyltransferase